MKFLDHVPLMKRLPKDQHPLVASVCETKDFAPHENVFKQGDTGDAFFVIRSGQASLNIKSSEGTKKVASLKEKDYFGENALLRNEPRTATITAETALKTYMITQKSFQELGLNDQLKFANRNAVAAGAGNAQKAKPPSPKTPNEISLISEALKSNQNLATMTTLDEARLSAVIEVMWKEEVKAGQELITEGDLQADYFYVVQSGKFEICVQHTEVVRATSAERVLMEGDSKVVNVAAAGGSFGELALLYFAPRAATVKAEMDSVVWVIDRGNFKDILMKTTDNKVKEYMKYLDGVEILSALLAEEKKDLAKALVEMHFTKEEVVVQQGEPGNTFYIMYDGSVNIEVDGNVVKSLNSAEQVQYFGEKALLENDTRAATVRVTSKTAKCLVLDRDSFDMLLGPLKEIIEADKADKDGRKRKNGPGGQHAATTGGKIMRKDLKRIGLLGCGGFGRVELVEHTTTGESYALKGLSKGYIVKINMQESVMNEKNILSMTNSTFITKLWETYNGPQSLYFLLEPCLGGELYATYNRKGLHGSEKHCRYYAAGVVYAFEHLHQRRIIYRDLKPENLLLTEVGHIKLTDMGLAKFVIGKTYTTCGTPDYFAPELIASTGHTNAVDWWTLGVLIFELISGHPPFESAYPMQIYAKVTKGIGKVTFPSQCNANCKNLIESLLNNEPSQRLPMRPGGVKSLMTHKWYTQADFDWTAMKELKAPAPYKPVVKSKRDLANFSARKEDAPRQLEYVDPGTGWDKSFATSS